MQAMTAVASSKAEPGRSSRSSKVIIRTKIYTQPSTIKVAEAQKL
jgi:hypothetical protein